MSNARELTEELYNIAVHAGLDTLNLQKRLAEIINVRRPGLDVTPEEIKVQAGDTWFVEFPKRVYHHLHLDLEPRRKVFLVGEPSK